MKFCRSVANRLRLKVRKFQSHIISGSREILKSISGKGENYSPWWK